jgi:hypothetical protein
MSKLFGKFLKGSSLLALVTAPAVVFAAAPTGPISVLGLQGSYNDFKLEGGSDTVDLKDRTNPYAPHSTVRPSPLCVPQNPQRPAFAALVCKQLPLHNKRGWPCPAPRYCCSYSAC